jgi:hypothetical protein
MMQRTHIYAGFAVLAALTLAPTTCRAQAVLPDNVSSTTIYGGSPVASGAPINVVNWGGGTGSNTSGGAYTSSGNAIKIDTGGMYQGATIVFSPPLALGDLKADKTKYLQFIYTVNGNPKYGGVSASGSSHFSPISSLLHDAQYAPAPRPMFPGQMPGGTAMPGMGRAPGPGGPRPGGTGAAPTGPTAIVPDALPSLPIAEMHFVFQFSDGSKAEMLRPVSAGSEDINWLRLSIPFVAIPASASAASTGTITQISIGSDSPAEIVIGEIRSIVNVTPISAFAGQDETLTAGTSFALQATADGGASTLQYDWDFDAVPPFVSEASGQQITHTYKSAGNYPVTLQVSDIDGLKAPTTSTVTIHVVSQ